jgi:TetR/AcrR family transcriptional repressor of mexJK operon
MLQELFVIFDCLTHIVERSILENTLSKDKERLILDAAQHRFAAYGYSKVTMDEIAEDIGLAKASLYYYFPTKDSIFAAVIAGEQDEFIGNARQLIASNSRACDKMRAYVERRLDFFRQAMTLGKLSIQTFSDMKPSFGGLFKTFAQQELLFLQQILDAGNESGEFAVGNTQEVALVFLHVLQGLRLRTFKSAFGAELGDSDFEQLRHETKIAMEIFLHGIRAQTVAGTHAHSHR